ncbi:hypothetical protein A2U01_0093174, partial [Trifolium medium]|nr:hypothetical protein [Trifolium medium]
FTSYVLISPFGWVVGGAANGLGSL